VSFSVEQDYYWLLKNRMSIETYLPSDGSIIVIDDKQDHAMPLLKLLGSQGVASTYYTGNHGDLPTLPCQKVRLAFLDIQLAPGLDSQAYADNLMSLLKRIVPQNNGPYVAVIWSTMSEVHSKPVEQRILSEAKSSNPVFVVKLRKYDYFNQVLETEFDEDHLFAVLKQELSMRLDDGDMDALLSTIKTANTSSSRLEPKAGALKLIASDLERELVRSKSFNFFTSWERFVYNASGAIVRAFASIASGKEFLEKNQEYCIYKMAGAQLGGQIHKSSPEGICSSAIKTLNSTLKDEVENHVSDNRTDLSFGLFSGNTIKFTKYLDGRNFELVTSVKDRKHYLKIGNKRIAPNKFKRDVGELDKMVSTQAEKGHVKELVQELRDMNPGINTRLLVDFNVSIDIVPGDVYEVSVRHWARRQKLIRNYLNKGPILRHKGDKKPVDNSHLNEMIFVELEVSPPCDYAQGKWLKSRLLPGVMIPEEYAYSINAKTDYLYDRMPLIKHKKRVYQIIFDFRLLKSIDLSKLEKEMPIFRLRNELLTDISTRAASHFSRVGIAAIE
jgi:hypothetical protein